MFECIRGSVRRCAIQIDVCQRVIFLAGFLLCVPVSAMTYWFGVRKDVCPVKSTSVPKVLFRKNSRKKCKSSKHNLTEA